MRGIKRHAVREKEMHKHSAHRMWGRKGNRKVLLKEFWIISAELQLKLNIPGLAVSFLEQVDKELKWAVLCKCIGLNAHYEIYNRIKTSGYYKT